MSVVYRSMPGAELGACIKFISFNLLSYFSCCVFCLSFTDEGSNVQRGFVFLKATQLVRKEFRVSEG